MGIKQSVINTDKENFTHINEIQNEYSKIDRNWLLLHYKISIGLVIFACIIECIMGVILVNSDMMGTTVYRFIWKFILFPSSINLIAIAIDTVVVESKRLSQKQKIYTVSLVFVGICFILFTVHSAFMATCYIFAIAIMLTTIYASYRVTGITAITSIVAIVISELFIRWDVDKISIFDSTLQLGNFLISLFVLIAFSIVCMVAIRFEQKKNEASIRIEIERQHLEKSLRMDELTNTFNRKALHDAMRDMEGNSEDDQYIFAIVDIDNFKGINDHWGHHVGDYALIEFAKLLKENCGEATIFRYGGDEFCLLFHNVDKVDAVLVCEKIKLKLNELLFEAYSMLKLTASFGLAAYSDQINAARLFINADQALYKAKEVRNTICFFDEEDIPKK